MLPADSGGGPVDPVSTPPTTSTTSGSSSSGASSSDFQAHLPPSSAQLSGATQKAINNYKSDPSAANLAAMQTALWNEMVAWSLAEQKKQQVEQGSAAWQQASQDLLRDKTKLAAAQTAVLQNHSKDMAPAQLTTQLQAASAIESGKLAQQKAQGPGAHPSSDQVANGEDAAIQALTSALQGASQPVIEAALGSSWTQGLAQQIVDQMLRQAWMTPRPLRPGDVSGDGSIYAMRLAPGKVWIAAESAGAPALPSEDIGAEIAATSLTYGQRRYRLSGFRLFEVLAKGVALDFDGPSFAPGRCAQTQLHRVPVLLHRLDVHTVNLHIPRSFAWSLEEWIADASWGIGAAGIAIGRRASRSGASGVKTEVDR